MKLKLKASPLLFGEGLSDLSYCATDSEIDDKELRLQSTELRKVLYCKVNPTMALSVLMKLSGVANTSEGVKALEHSIIKARL